MSKDELEKYITQSREFLGQKLTVEQLLARFNSLLQQRANELGLSVGDIKIDGVQGNDREKIDAIRSQFTGILDRTRVTPVKLPRDAKS